METLGSQGLQPRRQKSTRGIYSSIEPRYYITSRHSHSSIEVFQTHPDTSLLTVRIENVDGTEQRGARRNLMTPWTCCVEQFRLDRLAQNHPHFKRLNLNETTPLSKIAPVQCISGAFMLMPKRVFCSI